MYYQHFLGEALKQGMLLDGIGSNISIELLINPLTDFFIDELPFLEIRGKHPHLKPFGMYFLWNGIWDENKTHFSICDWEEYPLPKLLKE